jgi:hypothetical protein
MAKLFHLMLSLERQLSKEDQNTSFALAMDSAAPPKGVCVRGALRGIMPSGTGRRHSHLPLMDTKK